MILAPNIACIAGVFTMGFGIMASVVDQQRRRAGGAGQRRAPAPQGRPDRGRTPAPAGDDPKPMHWKETLYKRRLRRPIDSDHARGDQQRVLATPA